MGANPLNGANVSFGATGTGGNLFGSQQPAQTQNAGLLGNTQQQGLGMNKTGLGGSVFGNTATQQPQQAGSIFGSK